MIVRFFASATRAYFTNERSEYEFELPRILSKDRTISEFLHDGGEGIKLSSPLGEPFASRLSRALRWPEVFEKLFVDQQDSVSVFEIPSLFSSIPFHYLLFSVERNNDNRLWQSIAGSGTSWCYRVDRERLSEPLLLSRHLELARVGVFIGAPKISDSDEQQIFAEVQQFIASIESRCEIYSDLNGQNIGQMGEFDVFIYFGHSSSEQIELTIQGLNAEEFAIWALERGISLVLLICCEGAIPHLTEGTNSFVEALTGLGMAVVACQTTPHPRLAGGFLELLLPRLLHFQRISLRSMIELVCTAEVPQDASAWFPSMFSLFLP